MQSDLILGLLAGTTGTTLIVLGSLMTAPVSASTFTADYQGDFSSAVAIAPSLVPYINLLDPTLPTSATIKATNLSGSYTIDPARFLDGDIVLDYSWLETIESILPTFSGSYLGTLLDSFGLTEETALYAFESIFDLSLTGTGTVTPTGVSADAFNINYLNSANALVIEGIDPAVAGQCVTLTCNLVGSLDFSLSVSLGDLSDFLDTVTIPDDLPDGLSNTLDQLITMLSSAALLFGNELSLLTGDFEFEFDIFPDISQFNPNGNPDDFAFSLNTGDFSLALAGRAEPYTYSLDKPLAFSNIQPPIDEPTDEPIDEPVDEPIDEPIDEPVDEPIDEPVDEPIDEPVDEPIDEPVDEPIDEPIGDELARQVPEPSMMIGLIAAAAGLLSRGGQAKK